MRAMLVSRPQRDAGSTLVDRKAGRALCWKRIEGENSSDLRSFRGTRAINDLYSDLVQALETAADAAAKELAASGTDSSL